MPRFERLSWLAAIAPLFAACTQSHAITLEIVGAPADGTARTFTVRVYRGASCPPVEAFARDTDSSFERVYAQTGTAGAALAPVGRLDPGPYAFAALARDASCRPIAYGCVVADPSTTAGVRIELSAAGWDPSAGPCADGVGCNDGLCTGGSTTCDAATCSTPDGTMGTCCGATCVDLTSDGAHCGRCGMACAPGVRCSGGSCAPSTGCSAGCSPREACCGDRCTDTTSDPSACGACDHVCPTGLACAGGSCRPAAMAGAARLRLPDSTRTDCGRLMLVLFWVPTDASTGVDGEIGQALPLETAGTPGEVTFPLVDVGPPAESLRCALAPDCSVAVSFGQIWLAIDTNGDGAISRAELRGSAIVGSADAAIVQSSADIPRTDVRLMALTERMRIVFPEGIVGGTSAYRRERPGSETWIPTTDPFDVITCTSTAADCTAPVDEACRASLPRPFGYLP